MKKKLYIFCMVAIFFMACQTEEVILIDQDSNIEAVDAKSKKKSSNIKGQSPKEIAECIVIDADRCPNEGRQPMSSMWWPENETDFFNPTAYFSTLDDSDLTFTQYDDGSAIITGVVSMNDGNCEVFIDVRLVDRKTYAEFSATGGEFKREIGCASQAANPEEQFYYDIDSARSSITAMGGDCLEEGTYGLELRSNDRPSDPNSVTSNFRSQLGPNGAAFDSNIGALGFSSWGFITDLETGEQLWVMDFDFLLDCDEDDGEGCETAFARGDNGNTCFIDTDFGFNRWGWTIGPLQEGDFSYDIYAGAGQCDINKGEKVGTVDISYSNGTAMATYNIDDSYEVQETHTYAGNNMFPTKNGRPTVAPGQYSIETGLEGEIYVIAHAVVCRN